MIESTVSSTAESAAVVTGNQMGELIANMGPMFWLILAFAIIALAVIGERLFYFHRVNINSGDFLRGLSALLRSGQYNEALHEARRLPGPMARVVEAVLSRPKLARSELREIALEAADLEVYRVERNIRVLQVAATVMPLLGVLGTILAIMSFYDQPGITDGAVAAPDMSAALQQALLLSAAGVAMAIPIYLFYMFLASRARKIINSIKRAGLECVHIICDARMGHAARKLVKSRQHKMQPVAEAPATGSLMEVISEEEVSIESQDISSSEGEQDARPEAAPTDGKND